jgi:6-phosphogluconolactonase
VDFAGRFLYVSNRGHDSIAIFAIDAEQGLLATKGHVPVKGKTPRFFALDPAGTHLIVANQDSQNLVVFKIDPDTGGLAPTSSLEVFEPVSVVFVAVP